MADISCSSACRFAVLGPLLKIILAALFSALPMQVGIGWAASDLSEEQLRRLQQGDILVSVNQEAGPARGMVEAAILIDAPVDLIWRIMNDCIEIPTFIPGVEQCEVMESGENWQFIRHEIKWVWLLPRMSYVFRADYHPKKEIRFNRISGDLREMRGSWRLIPAESSGTFVRYRVYLDPGFLIPQWLVRSSLKRDLPGVLTALRNKVLAVQNQREE